MQNRRRFLQLALAAAPLAALARPAEAAAAAPLVSAARATLDRLGARIPRRDVVGIADFSSPSRNPRFHLLNMADGRIDRLLVAHGRGSDPEHSGWVKTFSNRIGSEASSDGAYLTSDYYGGRHGRSMRLCGLDRSNSNAEARAVVVHGAWYVSPKMVAEHGMLGRSEGCFAFDEADLSQVLTRLGPGRLLLAGKF